MMSHMQLNQSYAIQSIMQDQRHQDTGRVPAHARGGGAVRGAHCRERFPCVSPAFPRRFPGVSPAFPQEPVCWHARTFVTLLGALLPPSHGWMLPKASATKGQHFGMQAAHTLQCHGPQVKELLTAEQWEAIRDVASPASYFV